MSRLGIGGLPLACRDFDPEFAPLDAKGKRRFETAADAEAEDATRSTLLRRQQRKRSALTGQGDIDALREDLGHDCLSETLASARYMHDQRRRIAGAVWKLVCEEPYRHSPCTFTLIPRGLEVQPAHLGGWNAYALMNRLHSQIKRARAMLWRDKVIGPMTSRDWLIAGLHNELDPTVPLYQFHYHGLASGQMIAVLDAVRGQRAYENREGERVRDRVRMSRKELDNFPAPFGYSHQLFWPARARGDGSQGRVGFNQLHRTKRRLPEPYHTQALLWVDRQRIEDMTLLMGLRVGPNGLATSYPKVGHRQSS